MGASQRPDIGYRWRRGVVFLIFSNQSAVSALVIFRNMRCNAMDVQVSGEQIIKLIVGA